MDAAGWVPHGALLPSGFCSGGTGKWEGRKGVRSGRLLLCFLPAGTLSGTGKVYTEEPALES